MGFTKSNLETQLTIIWASAACGIGTGSLACSGDTLTYTAPGGSAGTAVDLLDGETAKIASATTTKYLVVRRSGTDAMSLTAKVTTDGLTSAHERIADVDAAIAEALQMASASEGDESVQYQKIEKLREYRKELEKQLAIEDPTLHGDKAVISYMDFS